VRAGDWPTAGLCQQRVPLALCYLGRLGEARAAVATARELNERIQNWGDFSLVSAAAQILATLEGRFDEAEAHAAETLRLIRRSRYPWAGPISLTALAGGRALRGDFEGARDALRALAVEGRIFDDPSAMRVIVAQLSPLLDALERGAAHVARGTPAERTVFAPDSLDLWRVTRVCAAVERAWRLRAPELARGARAALRHAEERGLVVTSGWVFVIPRCLGLAAALDGELDEARDALDRAIAWAEREGARAELARAYRDRAEVADARGGPGSGDARELRARGEKLCRELGIHPFALAGPATLAPDDRRLLASLARGGSTADAADDLILDEKTYAARLQRLFEKLGAGGPTEAVAAALALEGGSTSLLRALRAATPESAGAPLSVTILVTDLEGSTQLLSEVGDEAARDLLRLHNRIVRSCLQDTGGREIQQTGDGFLAWFDDAARAVRCAQEVQRRVARHARAHPGLALRVRSGLHAGTAFPDEERLVGIAVNVAARICTASAAGEILVSERVRDAASDAAVFTPRGPRALKGLADPIYLFSAGWR
jgi:class 3 adenylate cyclase